MTLQKQLGCKKRASPRKCKLLNAEQPKEVISKGGQEIVLTTKKPWFYPIQKQLGSKKGRVQNV